MAAGAGLASFAMNQEGLRDEIVRSFATMSGQIRTAARYVLDEPSDVALLSMREQARRAGVKPATMTRLAQTLGLPGYDELRAIHATAVRESGAGFAMKASVQVAAQKLKGDRAIAAEVAAAIASQIARLGEPETLDRLVAAGRRLAEARRVYCLGLRASHPTAWHLGYVLSLIGERAVQLDATGGTGADALARAEPRDVLFAVSVHPYTRATIELARAASERGVAIVAVTDSPVAPLAALADETVLAPTASPSFFHAMSPSFAVAEILAAIVAGRCGDAAVEGLEAVDAHLEAIGAHLSDRRRGAS